MGGASGTGRAGLRRADSRSFTFSCPFPPGPGRECPFLWSLRRASPRSTELPGPGVLSSPCLRPTGRPAKEAADCIFCSASSQPSPRTAPGPSSSRLRGPSLSAAGSGVRGRAFAGTSPVALPGGACARRSENAAEQRQAGVRLEMHEVGKSSPNPVARRRPGRERLSLSALAPMSGMPPSGAAGPGTRLRQVWGRARGGRSAARNRAQV